MIIWRSSCIIPWFLFLLCVTLHRLFFSFHPLSSPTSLLSCMWGTRPWSPHCETPQHTHTHCPRQTSLSFMSFFHWAFYVTYRILSLQLCSLGLCAIDYYANISVLICKISYKNDAKSTTVYISADDRQLPHNTHFCVIVETCMAILVTADFLWFGMKAKNNRPTTYFYIAMSSTPI